jgi:hypothetical protein
VAEGRAGPGNDGERQGLNRGTPPLRTIRPHSRYPSFPFRLEQAMWLYLLAEYFGTILLGAPQSKRLLDI